MKKKSVLVSIRIDPTLYREVKKAAIDRDDSVTSIVKRAFEKYVEEGKNMKERIVKAWYEQDFAKVAEELIAAADVWKNGSIDGCLVWDTEKEELAVVKESASTHTPSFIYLFRLSGNDKPDVDEDILYADLVEFDIESRLRELENSDKTNCT